MEPSRVQSLVDDIAKALGDVGCIVERSACAASVSPVMIMETVLDARHRLLGDGLDDPREVSATLRPPGATCDLVAVVGTSADLRALSRLLLGEGGGGDTCDPPYLVAIGRTRIFAFSRADPSTLPTFLRRWYAGMAGGDGETCVVCGTVAVYPEVGHPSCSQCCTRTCMDCFPSLVCAEAEDSAWRVFECPGCRSKAVTHDLVHLPHPADGALPGDVWDLVRATLRSQGRTKTGLVVAKQAMCTLVADVDARGRIDSPHWRRARRMAAQKGVIVGVGTLPPHGRQVGTPAREKFQVDPAGKAFICLGGGQAVELEGGWRYACCVFM